MTEIILVALGGLSIWVIISFLRNMRPSVFSARVNGALFDLGLQPLKFEAELSRIYLKDCLEYFENNRKNANSYEMATRFFLKAVIRYPAFCERAIMFDGFLVRSIKVVRTWREKKISAAVADDFIHGIKDLLLEGVERQPMDKATRLAAEIQILEL